MRVSSWLPWIMITQFMQLSVYIHYSISILGTVLALANHESTKVVIV